MTRRATGGLTRETLRRTGDGFLFDFSSGLLENEQNGRGFFVNTFRVPQNTVGRFRFDPPFRRYYFEDVTFMDPLLGTPIFLFW